MSKHRIKSNMHKLARVLDGWSEVESYHRTAYKGMSIPQDIVQMKLAATAYYQAVDELLRNNSFTETAARVISERVQEYVDQYNNHVEPAHIPDSLDVWDYPKPIKTIRSLNRVKVNFPDVFDVREIVDILTEVKELSLPATLKCAHILERSSNMLERLVDNQLRDGGLPDKNLSAGDSISVMWPVTVGDFNAAGATVYNQKEAVAVYRFDPKDLDEKATEKKAASFADLKKGKFPKEPEYLIYMKAGELCGFVHIARKWLTKEETPSDTALRQWLKDSSETVNEVMSWAHKN